jgi:hypothetical protein
MCVEHNHTQDTGHTTIHKTHRTTTNKTNNTTLYMLDITIHKTQTTTNKTNKTTLCGPTHIVLCYLSCLSSSCVLCMVVSNMYSVVLLITQHYMCWTQPYTRRRTTTNKTNNTTLCVLNTTIHKTQHI